MFSTIVVGTDGSETAQEALRKAAELAKQFDAQLHVVMAFKPAATAGLAAMNVEAVAFGGAEVLAKAESAMADEVETILRRLGDDLRAGGVKAETHGISGDAADVILEIAETKGADLIVVGNRGMSGAKRFLLGSVPNKVSHHSPCSVLIVHTV
jgi:nucleotide-binding universal stress UspA family protein